MDEPQMLLSVTLQYFHPMELSTAMCAVESLGIKTNHLMHLTHSGGVPSLLLTATILMVSVSHMEILVLGSISGPLLLDLELRLLVLNALAIQILEGHPVLFHHMLVMTSSARLAMIME